jgi:hypothetical protein
MTLPRGRGLRAGRRGHRVRVLNSPRAIALALLWAVMPLAAAPPDVDAERRRIAAERAAVLAGFDAREQQCLKRFAVTACLDRVRAERLEALDALREQELQLNEAERGAVPPSASGSSNASAGKAGAGLRMLAQAQAQALPPVDAPRHRRCRLPVNPPRRHRLPRLPRLPPPATLCRGFRTVNLGPRPLPQPRPRGRRGPHRRQRLPPLRARRLRRCAGRRPRRTSAAYNSGSTSGPRPARRQRPCRSPRRRPARPAAEPLSR